MTEATEQNVVGKSFSSVRDHHSRVFEGLNRKRQSYDSDIKLSLPKVSGDS